jgi:hypothetical protein
MLAAIGHRAAGVGAAQAVEDGQAEQQADGEQQPGRQLFVPARAGDVEADDRCERDDEERDAGATGEVAAEVRAERGAADGQRNEAHHLAEDRARAVAGDRSRPW